MNSDEIEFEPNGQWKIAQKIVNNSSNGNSNLNVKRKREIGNVEGESFTKRQEVINLSDPIIRLPPLANPPPVLVQVKKEKINNPRIVDLTLD